MVNPGKMLGILSLLLMSGLTSSSRAESTNLSWLVTQVSLSTLNGKPMTDKNAHTLFTIPPLRDLQAMPLQLPQSPSQRRWLRFGTDFSDRKEYPNSILGTIESAKHTLDWTSLELNDWLDTVRDSISFDYELRNLAQDTPATTPPQQIHGNFLLDAWENARFQSDISYGKSAHAFIGVKLTLPIGD
jgi:hypothetical protein